MPNYFQDFLLQETGFKIQLETGNNVLVLESSTARPAEVAGTVVVGTGGPKTAIVRRKYPVTTGTTAGTTKLEGRKPYLRSNQPTNAQHQEWGSL